jgi:hypothetical protein
MDTLTPTYIQNFMYFINIRVDYFH